MHALHSLIKGCVALLMFPALLLAQTSRALDGVVEDETAAAIPGARVTLLRQGTGAAQTTTSRHDGTFRFEDVPQASYVLKVEIGGFETYQKVVNVSAEELKPLRIRLRVAAEEEVTVEGRAAGQLSTSGSDAATTKLDDSWLRDLPVTSDDVLALIGRFTSPAAQGSEGASIVIDGVEGDQLDIPPSAIDSVRVNRNPYSAVFQHPGKARVEVSTKRGHRSRRLDGGIEMSARNSAFAARNAFAKSVPDLDRRFLQPNVGGALPGKKSSFYFAAARTVTDEGAVVNAITLAGPFVANVPTSRRHDSILTRIQWWPTALQTVYATYSFSDQAFRNRETGGFNLPERGVAGARHKHKVTLTHRALLPPNWSNSLIVGTTNENEQTGNPASAPAIEVNKAFAAGPSQSFTTDRGRSFNLENSLTYYGRAGHSIVFGGRLRGDLSEASDASNFGGTFEFGSLAQFAASAPLTFRINRGDPHVAFGVYVANGFAQDEIRVTPQLTLTVGLRYDWQSTTADHNNLAPRFAFAFAPTHHNTTVLRGGAGIFYNNLSRSATERSLLFDGVRLHEVVISNPSFPNPFSSGQSEAPPPSIMRVAPDLRSPQVLQASIGIEHELPHRNSIAAEYSLLRGAHLFRSRNINAPLPATGLRPDPGFLNINQVESTASERSQALTVTLQGRAGRFLKTYAQYVFSHTINDTSGTFSLPANNYDLLAERGPADFDGRHRFNLMGVVAFPRSVQTGLVLSVVSGSPFSVTSGFDDNGDTVLNDRPPGVTRNTLRGPQTAQLDLRVAKTFNIARLWGVEEQGQRRDTFEVTADVFNALNRTNVTGIVGVLSSPFFGRANAAASARTVQFSVRYRFRR
jgi:outer membrane receptor protein involved in Fe transport